MRVGEGFVRGRSDAEVRFFLREKMDCFKSLASQNECMSFLRTFHRWGDLVFIVDVRPVGG